MKRPWITGWWNQKYLGNRHIRLCLAKLSQSRIAPSIPKIWDNHMYNNFVFCQAGFLKPFMISFCKMPWLAGWFSLREIIKCTSVFHLVCLKKYNNVFTEVRKDKNTKENVKAIKEHKISNTLHREVSVVPKTDGEIYVSISMGQYIITLTFFLHCTNKGRVVENIESEVATWKIIIEKMSTLKW